MREKLNTIIQKIRTVLVPFLTNIQMNAPSSEADQYPRILLKVFIISRVLMIIAGIRFNFDVVEHAMHLMDARLMETALLQSLWYQHSQPPLFNILTALAVWITPNDWEMLVLWPIFTVLGYLIAKGIYEIALALHLSNRFALATAVLFTISPAAMYYETWYGYALPNTCALVWATVWLSRWLAQYRFHQLFLFFALLVIPVGMHALFQAAWAALAAVVLLIFSKGYRWQIFACAFIPMMILGSFYAKNWYVYSRPFSSSWNGLTMTYLSNVFWPDDAFRQKLVTEGKANNLIFMPRPDVPVAELPAPYNAISPTGIPILDNPFKANGDVNHNHLAYLLIGPDLWQNAQAVLTEKPSIYVSIIQNAALIYMLPTSDFLNLKSKRRTYYWDWLYHFLTAGRLGWDSRPVFHHLAKSGGDYYHALSPTAWETFKRIPWYLIPWLSFIILPGLIIFTGWQSLRALWPVANPRPFPERVLHVWIGYNIAYVTFMAIFVAITENQRYRFYISPLLALQVAQFISIWINFYPSAWGRMCSILKHSKQGKIS